jgi:glutaredoxin-like YruB-family protein
LICALLALPGCGIVKDIAKRSITRVAGGSIAGLLFGTDEATAGDGEIALGGSAAIAEVGEDREGGIFGGDDGSGDTATGGSGFYKVVEANGTVRFVSSLSEVRAAQRPKAERLDLQPIGGTGNSDRRAPSRQAARQLAVAKSAPPAAATSGNHEVVIYTTSWCGWCKKTRAWLDTKGIDYENRDVEVNAAWAEEMHDLTGSGGVPVIVIDGEVIKGFNQAQMEKLLRG